MLKTKTNKSISQMDREKRLICGETFDESWNLCQECKDRAQEDCVHIDASDVYYNCDICKAKKRLGYH